MPELPDVEGYRRFFQRHGTGKRVTGVWADRTELRNTNPTRLARELTGRAFERPRRHGKWLICPAARGGPMLVLHFGMSGELEWRTRRAGHRHDRMILEYADGDLHFRDMRKLGGVWLAEDERALAAATGPLGPDAAAIDAARFEELLASRRGGTKAALMDQSFLAGLGNLLVDATLWRAKIHPRRSIVTLSRGEARRLFDAMKAVIRESMPRGQVPTDQAFLTAQRSKGSRCPRCRAALSRETVAGRTTWFCARCQV